MALPTPSRLTARHAWLTASVVVWGIALAAGFRMLGRYELGPGTKGAEPLAWPADAGVAHDPQRMNLLVFLHPQCPCSEATVAELERVLVANSGHASVRALIFTPANEVAAWNDSTLARAAQRLPGVQVQSDVEGKIAARFGAETSGHVLLFDAQGRLAFSGGITGARGHEGDNAGRRAIVARLANRETGLVRTPTFGCSLREDAPATETRR